MKTGTVSTVVGLSFYVVDVSSVVFFGNIFWATSGAGIAQFVSQYAYSQKLSWYRYHSILCITVLCGDIAVARVKK